MAISNYSELSTAVSTRINRDDLATEMENFISLAESRLVRDIEGSELDVTTTLTVDAQTKALPDNFAGMKRAILNGSYPALDYLPPDTFHSTFAAESTGRPIAYTLEGASILFAPSPDTSYTMTYTYTAKPDLLTDDTNRLLTIYPDAYLFAALVEAADHVNDSDLLARYEARYQSVIQQINDANLMIGSPQQMVQVP